MNTPHWIDTVENPIRAKARDDALISALTALLEGWMECDNQYLDPDKLRQHIRKMTVVTRSTLRTVKEWSGNE